MSLIIQAPKQVFKLTIAGQQKYKVVFFGTPLFAVPALRALHEAGWPISAVLTAPDKPVGRRILLTPSPVKVAAEELGLQVMTPGKLSDVLDEIKDMKPDLGIVVAYGKIIPKSMLEMFPKSILNIHPSLLPAYRGPSPIQTAILDGKKETGISLMVLDEEMDHGPVLAQKKWDIPGNADYKFCEEELARLGAELLVEKLPGYLSGEIKPEPQDHAKATFTHKFEREDGRLDWTLPASTINDKIRAISDNPGTWTMWNDKSLNIIHAHVISLASRKEPGTVFLHGSELAVACKDDALAIETVKLEGSKTMSAKDFSNGHSDFVGSMLV